MTEPLFVVPESLILPCKPLTLPPMKRKTYEVIGRNLVAEVTPSEVWFHQESMHACKQSFRVTNTSSTPIRVSVITPEDIRIKLRYQKKGLLAPGMSETIHLMYQPTDWSFVKESVRISTEGGSTLLVPIYCVPGKAIDIPKRIDLGNAEIGSSLVRDIPLSNSTPIPFPFKIRKLGYCPEFTIEPMYGKIAPTEEKANELDETVSFEKQVAPVYYDKLTIKYEPIIHGTTTVDIAITYPHLNTEKVISLVGSALAKGHILSNDQCTPRLANTLPALSEMVKDDLKMKAKHRKAQPQVSALDETQKYEVIDGVYVPENLSGQSATEFVLRQLPGKLPRSEFIKEMNACKSSDKHRNLLSFLERHAKIEKIEHSKMGKLEEFLGELNTPDENRLKEILAERNKQTEDFRKDLIDRPHPTRTLYMNSIVPVHLEKVVKERVDTGIPASTNFRIKAQIRERFACAVEIAAVRYRASKRLRLLKRAFANNEVRDRPTCKEWVRKDNSN